MDTSRLHTIQDLAFDRLDHDWPNLLRIHGLGIEQEFVEALCRAFDLGEVPNDLTIALALAEFVLLSKLTVEQLSGLRSWSKGRARPATTPAPEQKGPRIAG